MPKYEYVVPASLDIDIEAGSKKEADAILDALMGKTWECLTVDEFASACEAHAGAELKHVWAGSPTSVKIPKACRCHGIKSDE